MKKKCHTAHTYKKNTFVKRHNNDKTKEGFHLRKHFCFCILHTNNIHNDYRHIIMKNINIYNSLKPYRQADTD